MVELTKEEQFLLNYINTQLAKGIDTWPNRDENNQRIHTLCLSLEKKGLIIKSQSEKDHVFWMPKEKIEESLFEL